jgi:excisionase family DNA binding protein
MELLKLREAAQILNISYPTLKQWIYRKKVRSIKTPGGHHRIARAEIDRLTKTREPRSGLQAISGRNKLMGTIVDLKSDGLLTQVHPRRQRPVCDFDHHASVFRGTWAQKRDGRFCAHQGYRSDDRDREEVAASKM